mgnify:CR=1 FL=1
MKVEFDPQADALYLALKDGQVADTLEVGKHIYVDIDATGDPLGIEVLFVSRRFATEDLATLTFNLAQPAPVSVLLPVRHPLPLEHMARV